MMTTLSFLVTRFNFNQEQRAFFLKRFNAMNKAGIALRSIFDNLRQFPSNKSEKTMSEHSLSNISLGRPFADGYAKYGWFDNRSTALLIAGEEYHCLDKILRHLATEEKGGLSFWRTVVIDNMRWFIASIIVLMICVILHTQKHLFTNVMGEPTALIQQSVFALGALLSRYGWILGLGFLMIATTLCWHLYFYIGAMRMRLDYFGIHALFRRYFLLNILPEISALMSAGLSARGALDACLTFYPSGYRRYQLQRLQNAIATGIDLIETLGMSLLDKRYAALASSIAIAYPGETEVVIENLYAVIRTDTDNLYRLIKQRLSFLLMMLIAALIYGILDIIYATPDSLRGY